MILEIILYGLLALLVLSLVYIIGGFILKSLAYKNKEFVFWYHFLPRKIKCPDCTKSPYFNRFPRNDYSHWNYVPTPDDQFMKKLADNVMAKIGNRSDKYKAGYILKLTQFAYTYTSDIQQYGVNERWAFPVCLGYLRRGDCEDGAVFGCTLSILCGLDAVMVSRYGHALYGVNVNGFGMKVDHNGKKYIQCETTAVMPMGITLNSGKFLGCYEVKEHPSDYIDRMTFYDEFDKYRK